MKSATILKNHADLSVEMLKDFQDIDVLAIVTWSLIYDRYLSSRRFEQFYDRDEDDYYAVFSHKELGQLVRVSRNTLTKYVKQLKEHKLLTVKKTFNGPNLYFPQVPEKYANNSSQTVSEHQAQNEVPANAQNLGFNHLIINRKGQNLTNHTDNTKQPKKSASEQAPAKTQNQALDKISTVNPVVVKQTPTTTETDDAGLMQDIYELREQVEQLSQKQAPVAAVTPTPVEQPAIKSEGEIAKEKAEVYKKFAFEATYDAQIKILGKPTATILKALAFGDSQTLYDFGGLVFKTKGHVYKQVEKQIKNRKSTSAVKRQQLGILYKASRFESNENMADSMQGAFKRIFGKACEKFGDDVNSRNGYIWNSLTDYFETAINEYMVMTAEEEAELKANAEADKHMNGFTPEPTETERCKFTAVRQEVVSA